MFLCSLNIVYATENIQKEKCYNISELPLDFNIEDIKQTKISDEKATEIAEAMLVASQEEMRKEIDMSISSITPPNSRAAQIVYLGTDKSITTADIGDYGKSSYGFTPAFYGSDYATSSKKARETALTGPIGLGTVNAWAYVGQTFNVSGSGTQSANVYMEGKIKGMTQAFAGGSASTNINFVVKDLTTGTSYKTNIYSVSTSLIDGKVVNQSFNRGIPMNLQGGHNYMAYLEVSGSGSAYSIGEAGSDFGPWDGDGADESVSYTKITIDF